MKILIIHIKASYDQNISLIFYVKDGSHVRLWHPSCVYITAQRQYTAVHKMRTPLKLHSLHYNLVWVNPRSHWYLWTFVSDGFNGSGIIPEIIDLRTFYADLSANVFKQKIEKVWRLLNHDTGCPKKNGNSVTNWISSLLWISIVIPNFRSHNIIMSARVYFMKRVNDVSRWVYNVSARQTVKTDKFTLFLHCNFLVLLSTTVCSEKIKKIWT